MQQILPSSHLPKDVSAGDEGEHQQFWPQKDHERAQNSEKTKTNDEMFLLPSTACVKAWCIVMLLCHLLHRLTCSFIIMNILNRAHILHPGVVKDNTFNLWKNYTVCHSLLLKLQSERVRVYLCLTLTQWACSLGQRKRKNVFSLARLTTF